MTYLSMWYRSALAGIALIAGLGFVSTSAFAQTAGGTASGTSITNQAVLNYNIAGAPQPVINSNTTTFVVDNLVRVVVAEVGASHTVVAPNATAQVTTFTVTNTGNTTQDFSLATANITTGGTVTLGATLYTDAFDSNGACSTFVESGATAGYQVAQDTAQAILSLGAIAAGGANTRTVYVVCNIPAGAANNTDAIVSLTATTANAGTCAANGTGCVTTLQTAGADTQGSVDVVFADAAGSDDIVRDGKHSARDAYRVAAASVTVTKTVTVVCDPLNFNVNPKSIPGAYVRYEITIANAGTASASATLSTIQDTLNANTTFDPDLRIGTGAACATSAAESAVGNGFKLSCTGGARACVGTPVFYTTSANGDAMELVAGVATARFGNDPAVTGTQALPAEAGGGGYAAGELKPGESVTIRFNAIIN